MYGIVAVLHEHPAKVPELHGDGDASARAEAVDVLATLFPRWDVAGLAVAGENLALLEVDVDRVIPAAAAVFQRPDLAGAVARRRGDPAEVRGERSPGIIRLDAPGAKERRDGVVGRLVGAPVKLEFPLRCHGNLGKIRVRDQDVRHLAPVGIRRIPDDPELEELPDAGIVRFSRERLAEREVFVRSLPILMLSQVHHPDLLPDLVAGEINDDVVALGDAQLVRLAEEHPSGQQVPVVGDQREGGAIA